jgi:hypothetical protein
MHIADPINRQIVFDISTSIPISQAMKTTQARITAAFVIRTALVDNQSARIFTA